MRILFVMYNMEIGGTRKSLLNLLSYLEKYEVEVDLLLFSPFGIFMNEIPEYVNIIKGNLAMQSVFCFKQTLYNEKRYDLIAIRGILKVLKKINGENKIYKKILLSYAERKIDSKKYNAVVGFQEGMCAFFTTFTDISPKICWIHNNAENLEKNVLGKEEDYGKIDHILFVAERSKNSFVKKFPLLSKKTAVIKNVLPQENILRAGNEKCREAEMLFKDKNTLNIVSVGRISKQKAFERIIEVVPKLSRKVNWVIIGDGEDYNLLVSKVKDLKLDKVIHFIGSRKNPFSYVKNADVYVLTSLYESQPMVIMEALTLGIPVISTNFASATEMLSGVKYGMICENSSSGILNAIEEITTERLKEMKAATQEFIYDNDYIIRQIMELIEAKS